MASRSMGKTRWANSYRRFLKNIVQELPLNKGSTGNPFKHLRNEQFPSHIHFSGKKTGYFQIQLMQKL